MTHLAYGLYTPCDLLEKLKFEAKRLEQNFNSYDFFNFVVTAYHLCDWIEKDANIPLKKGDILDKFFEIKICRDLANASKHFRIDPNSPAYKKYPPIVSHADSVSGFGFADSHGGMEKREEISIEIKSPKTGEIEMFDAHDLIKKVVEI